MADRRAIFWGSTIKCDESKLILLATYDSSTSEKSISLNDLPCLWIKKVPPSPPWGLIPSLDPRLVADFTTMLDGVIGSRSDWGTKNSAPDVKIWRSLPDRRAWIELTLSVVKVIWIASSSRPSSALKSKYCPTLDPYKVEGELAVPPR